MSGMKTLHTVMMIAAMFGGSMNTRNTPGEGDDIKRGEVFDRKCRYCHQDFQTTNRYQKFCGEKCRDAYGKQAEEFSKKNTKKRRK